MLLVQFIILLDNIGDITRVNLVIDRIKDFFDQVIKIENHEIKTSASIGVVMCDSQDADSEDASVFDVEELSLASPFDFEKQARIYLPAHLPDPREPEFVDRIASEAAALIEMTKGGALLLFTSIHNMKETHRLLEGRVGEPLLVQGDAPKTKLLERFAQNPGAVLLATASFWQGVDIPGYALRLVIIDKLPFSSPSDPLVSARIERIQELGGRPFWDYQVPQAALALKQGFGRLIRTKRDFGFVAIFDKRLASMSYSGYFLKSLPHCPVLKDPKEMATWWPEARRVFYSDSESSSMPGSLTDGY